MVHGNWTRNSIAQVSVIATDSGQDVVNVFHFESEGTNEALMVSDALAQTWADAISADWIANIQAAWNACHGVPYTNVLVRSQVLERPGQYEHRLVALDRTAGISSTGVLAAGHDSMADAAVVRWKTPQAGRSHRGRTYVGPAPATFEAVATPGLLTALAVTNLTAWASAMKTRYTGTTPTFAGQHLTIYSRPYDTGNYSYVTGHGPARHVVFPPDYAGNSTNVTDYAIDPVLRSQRRREIGVGS